MKTTNPTSQMKRKTPTPTTASFEEDRIERRAGEQGTQLTASFAADEVDDANERAEEARHAVALQIREETIAAAEACELPAELEEQITADERERAERETAEAEVIPQKSIYVRGPFQDEGEITWDVFPGISPTTPRGRIYTCHTPEKAMVLAGIMSQDRGLALVDARS